MGALTLYCADRHLAEELAQEALARACRSWSRVSVMSAPGAWVHRVAINLANRHFRRRRLVLGAARRRNAGMPEAHDDDDVATAVAVRAAVAALPVRQRTALVLRYYSDLPVAEVAVVMGCAEGTVRAWTFKAIRALRAHGGLLDVPEVLDDY